MWWLNRFNGLFFLQDDKGEGDGGGGKADDKGADLAAQLKEQTDKNLALEARLKALESKAAGSGDGGNPDLAEKARKEREAAESAGRNQKQMESALRFGMESATWIKDNATLLPKTVPGIFEQAAKENYANVIEKDSAIKAGIISEFFSLQENIDLLTPALRSSLEEFGKLTKNVKQERAQSIYENVFEPAFAMKRAIAKAAQLAKGGVQQTNVDAAYKQKMIDHSKKHYLGEK